MGVLAHEIWAVIEPGLFAALFADIVHHFDAGVHLAAHIVSLALAVDGALIVHRQGRVLLEVIVHGIGVVIAARLVAKAPHNNRCVPADFVPLIQPHDAVHIVAFPLGVVADGVIGRRELHGERTVRLQVIFVYNINAKLVRQFQQQWVRGIVRCAHGVDVEPLTDQHITLDIIGGHGVAIGRIGIVVVHALKFDFAAIEQEHILLDFNRAEADFLFYAAGGGFIVNIVQCRDFGIPLGHIKPRKHSLRRAIPGRNGCCLLQAVALDGKRHVNIRERLRGKGQRVAIGLFLGFGINVPQVRWLLGAQQHIAEDAVIAEHILVFQIGPIAPAVYHNHQFVMPGFQLSGQIKLRRVVRTLGIADKEPVYIQIHAAGNA